MSTTDAPPQGDVEAAVAAGQKIAKPAPLGSSGRFFAVANPVTGETEVVDVDELRYDHEHEHAARKTGERTLRDAESFVAYVTRHGGPDTEVWADVKQRAVLAVINADAPGRTGNPGHGDHRATLKLRTTTAWDEWLKLDGKLVGQEQFAEHIETRQLEVIDPAGGTLLEIASTFKATKAVEFESAKRLSDGQTVLEYRETVNASAGKKGDLAIPETFTLALAPFEGAAPYKITARLRTRVDGGHLYIGYLLDRPDEVLEAAFADILRQVTTGLDDTGIPILNGWPA